MSEYHEDFKLAGTYAKEVLRYGEKLIKPGATYVGVLRSLYAKINELGAKPAFPPQMAFNETAAHFMPAMNEDVTFSNQLIKLDVGVAVNGAIGDNALTVDLSGKYSELVKASREAVEKAVDIIEVDIPIRNVGIEIEQTIQSYGFEPVRNLSGHGLGKHMVHCKPTIPNFDNKDETVFKPNMTFACEPFATTGIGKIHESGQGWIFRFLGRRPVRSPIAKKLMNSFEQFEGMPFSLFELELKDPLFQVRAALKQLEYVGAVESYPPLVEDERGFVSQAEHSILIDDDGKKFVTTR